MIEERPNHLPVAPSLQPIRVRGPDAEAPVTMRVVLLSGLALGVGAVGALLAEVLLDLIALMTNLAFYHRVSTKFVPPATDAGAWLLVIPVVGALIVGLMARFGSRAIRGHGIPEVMENILEGGSRIPARLMFLKPLSAAVAIGTGGPRG